MVPCCVCYLGISDIWGEGVGLFVLGEKSSGGGLPKTKAKNNQGGGTREAFKAIFSGFTLWSVRTTEV